MSLRVGVTLPQFRDSPEPALEASGRAEDAGLDGVFVFDHLWPLGRPDRPALHGTTLLGAVAAETARVQLGPLVARVGLVPDAVLVHTLRTLARMVGDRLVAGLGTGDAANRQENLAYGVRFPSREERVQRLGRCCDELRGDGVRTWVGGNSVTARTVAAEHATGWNGWGLDVAGFEVGVADLRGRSATVEATWGGQVLVGRTAEEAAAKLDRYGDRPGLVHGTVAVVAHHLEALAKAGATWAVCAPLDVGTDPTAVEYLAEAAAAIA